MGTLKIITSHSLARLAATLADNLVHTPSSLLEPETVVVLNNGMARWISLELAARQGVCAGLDFRFPNEIMDSCFNSVLPSLPANSPFTRDAMTWRIAARLPGLLDRKGFEQITRYLGHVVDDRRLFHISRTMADLFDQYIIFRPEMILAWDNGKDEGWQSVLWREISADAAGRHRAALLRDFRERIESAAIPAGVLPRRISLFGISYLPPFHLQAFSHLARFCEITFYLQNPCGTYWSEIVSRQRLAELALRDATIAEEYYDTGNPLLSSLGTMGQEFHDMLLEFGFDTIDLDINSNGQTAATLLEAVQHDIRQLRDSGGRDEKHLCLPDDRSILVNSCHGPLREMEILQDHLLAMFDEISDLEPRQILVMIPDIEAYVPYIAAVFGARSGDRPAIPFTVADRSQRRENRVIETFFRILGLPVARFGVNRILELLEAPQVMARFNIIPDELETIRQWLRVTGVRWGFDGGQRVALGFPAYDDFSWQAALDRLYLGYAMACDGDRLFHGILPSAGVEGQTAAPLGKLAGFLQVAQSAVQTLTRRHTLEEWADKLTAIALDLMLPEDGENGLAALFAALQNLRESQKMSGFCTPVNLEVVQDCLTGLLDNSAGGDYGFLGGRVTFCAMLPMRSIPFRVICLAGMNDGIFPRNRRQPVFSLLAGRRRRGDRSLRDEDRYLFLETIMAAGERLYISYTGQSDRDNSVLPPSVVVAELLDYVQRGFNLAGTDAAPTILVKHRLQAFSADYFNGIDPARLFSYSTECLATLRAIQESGRLPRSFINEPLVDDLELLRSINLTDLKRFLANPAATFLDKRLGIRPYQPGGEADEREPFALDSLTAYGLRQELVQRALTGAEMEGSYQVARAMGLLPPLAAGELAFAKTMLESREFAATVAPLLEDPLETLAISFAHDGMTLVGALGHIRKSRHVRWRYAAMKARDRLDLWLEHLLLNALAPAGYPRESLLVCSDLTLTMAPLENGARILGDLMELYRKGLRRPLHFFPQVSWLYLADGMEKAQGRWNGNDHAPAPPESSDPACLLCFRDQEPLDEEFEELSRMIFEPLVAVTIEEKRA